MNQRFTVKLACSSLLIALIGACGIIPDQAAYDPVVEGAELKVPAELDRPSQRGTPIPDIQARQVNISEKPVPLEEQEDPQS